MVWVSRLRARDGVDARRAPCRGGLVGQYGRFGAQQHVAGVEVEQRHSQPGIANAPRHGGEIGIDARDHVPRKLDQEEHLEEVKHYILQRWIETGRQSTLVICQQKVETWLQEHVLAHIIGTTPEKSAPAWAAGANSRPAFTSSTMGAPQPSTMAASPIQPRRSIANPLRSR
jgi:hypothetical protein